MLNVGSDFFTARGILKRESGELSFVFGQVSRKLDFSQFIHNVYRVIARTHMNVYVCCAKAKTIQGHIKLLSNRY